MKVGFKGGNAGLDLKTLKTTSAGEVDYHLVRGEEKKFLEMLLSEVGAEGVSKLLFRLIKALMQFKHLATESVVALFDPTYKG